MILFHVNELCVHIKLKLSCTVTACFFSQLITKACVVQALNRMHLLTITCLYDKVAVVTKALVKSICLGV